MSTPYYRKHVFLCTNQKEPGKPCCNQHGATQMAAYLKEQLQAKDLFGPGKIRVSTSGCMGRCKAGPWLVVYPDAIWYRYDSEADIDRIIEAHLQGDQIVTDLQVDEP